MVEVVKTVRNSGGDYTSISAFIAGEQRALGADEVAVAELYDDFPGGLTDSFDVAGFTNTNATAYVEIRPAAGHEHGGVFGGGARVNHGVNLSDVASLSNTYTRLTDLQINHTHGTDGTAVMIGAANCKLERCIIQAVGGTSWVVNAGPANTRIYSCSLSTADGATGALAFRTSNWSDNLDVRGCSIRGSFAFDGSSLGNRVDNSVVLQGAWNNIPGNVVGSNNAVHDGATASIPGTSPLAVNLVDGTDVTDIVNGDYSLPAGSRLIDAGADITGTVVQDVAGVTLTVPCDIGGYQLTIAAGAMLAGAAAGQATASADLGTAIQADGAAVASATADGSLTTEITLTGAALNVATANGAISTQIPLAGVAASVVTATGNMTAKITLTGAAIVEALATGSLGAGALLAGDAASVAGAGGDLDTGINLSGSAAAQVNAQGQITAQVTLSGTAVAEALASGDLSAPGSGMSGQASARVSATGQLITQIPLSGDARAFVTAAGGLTTLIPLSGAAAAVSTANGGLTAQITFQSSAIAQAFAQGDLASAPGLSGAAIAEALASASLTTQIPLSGSALADASAAGLLSTGVTDLPRIPGFTVQSHKRKFRVRARGGLA